MVPWQFTNSVRPWSRCALAFPRASKLTNACLKWHVGHLLQWVPIRGVHFKWAHGCTGEAGNPIHSPTFLSSPVLTMELMARLPWPFFWLALTRTTHICLSQIHLHPILFFIKVFTRKNVQPKVKKKKKSQLNVGVKLKRLEIEKLPVLTAHLLTRGLIAPEIMPGLWKWKLAVRERWLMTAEISHVIGQAFSVIAFLNETGLRNRG